jgi:hypothetical protein
MKNYNPITVDRIKIDNLINPAILNTNLQNINMNSFLKALEVAQEKPLDKAFLADFMIADLTQNSTPISSPKITPISPNFNPDESSSNSTSNSNSPLLSCSPNENSDLNFSRSPS